MAVSAVTSLSCLLLAMVCTTQGGADLHSSCLRCLCEAVSGSSNCVYGAPSSCHDGVCGPYAITLPYWQDAGRPTVGIENRLSDITYQKCALDITCAEATIRGYMNRFHQDCNGDGVEDCFDYAAIHYQGGYSCHEPLSVHVRNTLTNCLQREGPREPEQPPVPPPVPFPYPLPEQEVDDNDIQQPTTPPAIDIRLGAD